MEVPSGFLEVSLRHLLAAVTGLPGWFYWQVAGFGGCNMLSSGSSRLMAALEICFCGFAKLYAEYSTLGRRGLAVSVSRYLVQQRQCIALPYLVS